MNCTQQTTYTCVLPYYIKLKISPFVFRGTEEGPCQLTCVNFEAHDNRISHETLGLSENLLVVRRGKPFKVTLLFGGGPWDPRSESLVLEVRLGDMFVKIPVHFSGQWSYSECWSANIYPGDFVPRSATIHIYPPVLSAVAPYKLLVHIESRQEIRTYLLGKFVLLFNPWLKEDPVYMPLDAHKEEYIKSDYGLVYTGTAFNNRGRPWLFGQYEPGVLEACIKLMQVSPQHLQDRNKDYRHRADPVYLSRVLCAMVNCNDDLGILQGKWHGSFEGGVRPTEWSGSADILHRWISSNCSPVRYGQCWVYASVLCTVMRVLGIPSRVVTVFNAAHDGDGSLNVEEYYSTRGEKLNLSKDSIWNFHVWVECWMRRADLGAEFDGWQVLDPTPQEKSEGIFCCGPCPVTAIQRRCLSARYDASFIYASVDADVIRMMVQDGLVVGRTVGTEYVGQLIYTKRIGLDKPEDLTDIYKSNKNEQPASCRVTNRARRGPRLPRAAVAFRLHTPRAMFSSMGSAPQSCAMEQAVGGPSPSLEVSLSMDGAPCVGDSIVLCVTVTNRSGGSRVLLEYVNAQLKEYDSGPQESFWKTHKEVHMQPGEVLKLHHSISLSQYEAVLSGDDHVNVAVVMKDVRTKERFLATQEFNMRSPQIHIEVEGGDSIPVRTELMARASYTNMFNKAVRGAVLTLECSGLILGRHEARLVLMQSGDKIEKKVSILATSPGTKVLMATFSHSGSPSVVSRSFHKVSVAAK